MKALQIAASGMAAQQMRVDVVSNNLANMSTTGYNARRAEFADLHYQQLARPGTVSAQDGTMLPTGVQVGLAVRASHRHAARVPEVEALYNGGERRRRSGSGSPGSQRYEAM